MRAAIAIAWAEARRVARDRAAVVFVVLMPLLIILVVGLAFPADAELRVGIVDEDGTAASARIVDALAESAGLETRSVDSASQLDRDIRLDDLDGGVVIPAGYAESLAGGTASTVRITTLPTSPAALTVMVAIEGVVTAQTTRDEVVQRLVGRGSTTTDAAAAVDAAIADWAGVGVRTEIEGSQRTGRVNAFSFIAPGQLTLFLFASALAGGAALVEVRRLGIIDRIRATPTSRRSLLGGLVGGRLAFSIGQGCLIIGFGALLFGVEWGDPVAAAALLVAFSTVAVGTGVLVGTLSRNPDQVMAFGIPIGIALAMLGGCMWPKEIMPPPVQRLGRLTPHSWAMDGWTELIFEGGDLSDIAVPLAVLTGFAVVAMAAALAGLRRSL